MGWAWGALAFAGLVGLAHLAIRRGLAHSRGLESGSPDVLPRRDVRIPASNGKHLHGWFILAGERAPALVVMHGWGGNSEMMLPLAAPQHAAGYALLLVPCSHDSYGGLATAMEALLEFLGRHLGR